MSVIQDSATQVTSAVHIWYAEALTVDSVTQWVSDRLKSSEAAIEALLLLGADENERRTIDNSLRLYDVALEQLSMAGAQAGVLNSVAADKAVRDQAQLEAQRIAEAATKLSLNREVYLALSAVDLTGASEATRHFVNRTLLSYRLAGVDKDDATRAHLSELHEKATRLSLEFSRNIQEGAKYVLVEDVSELEGLPSDYLARHTPNGEGQFALSTDQPDMQPVMTFAKSDALRERMFLAYNTRAYPTNSQILLDLLGTRQEIATLLGFSSWANLATADQMMGSADSVKNFISKLEQASRSGAQREYNMVLEFAQAQQPSLKFMNAASRAYWYEEYRRAAFDFDSQSVRPYFPYARVEKGVLDTASKLFQVIFQKSSEPGWHEDVSVWDVFNNEGETLVGRFYLDMHPREGKDKWFSATPVVTGVRGRYLPEAGLICNFPRPTENDPGLMQYSDVVTYFHEFGHLMHAILGGHTEWAGLSGFATEGDFIEVPSQMLEEFFRDVALLQSFARHYQTDEVLPEQLIQKMKLAGAFGRADWVRSQLFYTTLSLDLHNQDSAGIDLDRLTKSLYESLQPWQWIDGNRMYASFGHLMGYSSNYYTYAYDKVIALDFFAQFDPADLLGCDAGAVYRKKVIEQGGSRPGRQMVRDFLGRDEEFSAFTNWLNEEFESEALVTL